MKKKFLSHENVFVAVRKLADKYIPADKPKVKERILSMFNVGDKHNRDILRELVDYLKWDKSTALRAFKKYIIALDKQLHAVWKP